MGEDEGFVVVERDAGLNGLELDIEEGVWGDEFNEGEGSESTDLGFRESEGSGGEFDGLLLEGGQSHDKVLSLLRAGHTR